MNDDDEPIPVLPLFGEDYIPAQVLDIVSRYCNAGGELDSRGVAIYAELMRLCAEGGDIEITGEFGDRLTGTITAHGRAYLNRFRADRLTGKDIDWSQCPDVESIPGKCSGAWVVKDSRVMVQAILDNAEDCSAEEISAEEMQRRRAHVKAAIADSRIEGLPPPTSPELEIFAAYIRGEIEAADLVTACRQMCARAYLTETCCC
jgi:uncharacterized protein (DUF433 family)